MCIVVGVGIIFAVPDGDILVSVQASSVESGKGVECSLMQHGYNMGFKAVITLEVGFHSASGAFGKLGCK